MRAADKSVPAASTQPPPSPEPKRVAVIGCGGWGTALALVLNSNGYRVTVWGVERAYVDEMRHTRLNPRYLPDVPLPPSIELTGCVPESEIVVAATPTVYMRAVCERLRPLLTPRHLVVNVAKGIEEGTLLTGSQIIGDVCGGGINLAGLYGPSHAEEVARGLPTTVVATAASLELAREVQSAFMTPSFRVYTNNDVLGVELGAALKNVIAIAAGASDGLGFGDNAKSALMTRGLAEIRRLGVAMGARAETFSGLTGLGDLITTCISPYGRNRAVGMRIARGETLEQILDSMDQVAEGIRTTRSAVELARRHEVEMPICHEVHAVLFEGKDPQAAVRDLMLRAPRPELDDMP